MKRMLAGLGISTGLAMLVTASVSAQELEPGTWTGTMSPPGNESVSVSYEVGETDGALSIVMSATGRSISLNEVALDGDELTFWWEPGPRVDASNRHRDRALGVQSPDDAV